MLLEKVQYKCSLHGGVDKMVEPVVMQTHNPYRKTNEIISEKVTLHLLQVHT